MFGGIGALARRSGVTVALAAGLGLAVPGIAQATSTTELEVSGAPTSGVTCTGTAPMVCSPDGTANPGNLNVADLESDLQQGSVELTGYSVAVYSALTLPNDLTIDAPSNVLDAGTIDGPGALTVGQSGQSGSGFSAYASLGATTALGSLTDYATLTALESVTNSIVTTGHQSYGGQLEISGPTTLDSSAGNGDITLGTSQSESVLPSGPGEDPALTLNAGTGSVSIPGTLGTNLYINGDGSPADMDLGDIQVTGSTIDLPPAVFGKDSATFDGASVVADGGTDLQVDGTTSFPDGVALGGNTLSTDDGGTSIASINDDSSGAILADGGSTLSLSGSDNQYTGGTRVSGGATLSFQAGSLGSGPITVDGGTLDWGSGNTSDISGQLTIDNTDGGTLDIGANDVTLGSNLSTSGPVTTAGSGTLTLAGTDSFGSGAATALTADGDGAGNGALNVTGTLGGWLELADGTLSCNSGGTVGTINAAFTDGEGGSAGIASTSLPATPGTPTASPGDGKASVAFTAGAVGCDPTTYRVTATPTSGSASAVSVTGSSSPVTVSGLQNGQSYTFSVVADNPLGSSSASPSSAAVTPQGATGPSPVTPPGATGIFHVEHVSGKGIRVIEKVSCAAGGAACRLTVSLTAKEKSGKRSRTVRAGHRSATVVPGATSTISVTLSRSAVKLLHKLGRLPVKVTTSEPGASSVRHSVTLRYRRRKR